MDDIQQSALTGLMGTDVLIVSTVKKRNIESKIRLFSGNMNAIFKHL